MYNSEMSAFNLDEVTKALESASEVTQEERGLSFEGHNLKLNNADDAKPLVDAILQYKDLGYLNLAGNTLGVDAAAALAKALEKHPEFKRALWKDLFTGRLKEEIPKALQHLGDGLVLADARLTELDLSDNAFGPIGVRGLASLLRSRACFALGILRLNNNGLGITGGKLLAGALTDCYKFSKEQGTPLQLKVFIAGRNRLENEGAKALAAVFSQIESLEEIAMPQNGIYHVGISALSESFERNVDLQVLNLNDNTLGPKGSRALGKAIKSLQQLRVLNLGDCLLKTKGVEYILDSINKSHTLLEEINLESNEIKPRAGPLIANAMVNKQNLSKLLLDANQFGSKTIDQMRDILSNAGFQDVLAEFDDDESNASNEEEENEEESEEEESEEEEIEENITENLVTVQEFLSTPSADNFINLGDSRTSKLMEEATKNTDDNNSKYLEYYISLLMKVSALVANAKPEVTKAALETSDALYKELFSWSQKNEQQSLVNNALLVHLGLIKSEDKMYKPIRDVDGCLLAVENVIKQQFFPIATKDTLKVFMGRCCKDVSPSAKKLMVTLKIEQ